MPNLSAVLKDEITRLARKEVRAAVDAVKVASVQQRKDLTALKKGLTDLARAVARLVRDGAKAAAKGAAGRGAATAGGADAGPGGGDGKKRRFSAARLKAMRERMDLSAGDLGKLVGVSTQSIYNWEQEKSRPRAEQIAKLAELRDLSKRELVERLQAAGKPEPKAAKRPKGGKATRDQASA